MFIQKYITIHETKNIHYNDLTCSVNGCERRGMREQN